MLIFIVSGKGLFAKKNFEKDDYLLEYNGEVITEKEVHQRERDDPRCKDYMFSFMHEDKAWW